MREIVLAAALAAELATGPAAAQDRATEIRAVISEQITALRADDFATAFGFASPAIRRQFGGPEPFGRMVREGYPMVWRPGEVRFAALVERDGRPVQSVVVTDEAGVPFVLEYEMVPTDEGWRIDGVRLREAGGAGA